MKGLTPKRNRRILHEKDLQNRVTGFITNEFIPKKNPSSAHTAARDLLNQVTRGHMKGESIPKRNPTDATIAPSVSHYQVTGPNMKGFIPKRNLSNVDIALKVSLF